MPAESSVTPFLWISFVPSGKHWASTSTGPRSSPFKCLRYIIHESFYHSTLGYGPSYCVNRKINQQMRNSFFTRQAQEALHVLEHRTSPTIISIKCCTDCSLAWQLIFLKHDSTPRNYVFRITHIGTGLRLLIPINVTTYHEWQHKPL